MNCQARVCVSHVTPAVLPERGLGLVCVPRLRVLNGPWRWVGPGSDCLCGSWRAAGAAGRCRALSTNPSKPKQRLALTLPATGLQGRGLWGMRWRVSAQEGWLLVLVGAQ